MGITKIIFWTLSFVIITGALGVIISRKPVNSALSLLMVLFAVSGLLILMNAQFLAMVNIIVYAGAIMVLFFFLMAMVGTDPGPVPMRRLFMKIAGVISGLALMIIFIASFAHSTQNNVPVRPGTVVGFAENIGKVLFEKYLIPLELTGVLFLSAIAGMMVVVKNEKRR